MEYSRNCPICNEIIIHSGKKAKYNCNTATKKMICCLKCSYKKRSEEYKGINNPFYNKKHSEEFKLKLSNERKGLRVSIKSEFKKNHSLNEIYNQPKYSLIKLMNDNIECFYWLGFILADGSFYKNRFEFSLQEKDLNHLKLLSNYLDNAPIYKKNNSYKISFNNKKDIEIIKEKFNINSRKTYNPPDFNYYISYNNELLFSMLFGLIDGDGNININEKYKTYAISITAHHSWLTFYKNLLDKLNILYNISYTKNVVVLRISKKNEIKKIYTEYQKLNIPKLERKWKKIEKL